MRRLLIVLTVLLVLLLGADRLGALLAGRVVAEQVRTSQDLTRTPDVTVGGFPFLTQVVAGRYEQVDVSLQSVPATAGLRLDGVDARLEGLRLSAGDALARRVDEVPVDRAEAVVRVGFDQLDAAVAGAQARSALPAGLRLRFGPGGAPDRVSVRLAGLPAGGPLEAEVSLQASGGRLSARLVRGSLDGLPAAIVPALDRAVRDAVRLPPLPFGIRTTAVRVDPDGLVVTAVGRGVTLRAS